MALYVSVKVEETRNSGGNQVERQALSKEDSELLAIQAHVNRQHSGTVVVHKQGISKDYSKRKLG